MKITIIGAGNMGGALAWGLARSGAAPASDLTVTARHEEKLEKFKALGLQTATDNVEAVRGSDLVFYAVKPWQMEAVVRETAPVLDYGRQTAVSVAPGIRPEDLKAWFIRDGALPQLAYAIPNTAVEVGEGATYLASVTASEDTISQLVRLFDRVGKSFVVPLDRMLAGTSLASCGIAYAMRYMGAAAEGGARLGLDPRQASEAVCQTVRGAAALVGAKDYDTEGEISRVTTPNGLTARGLAAMEAAGFSDAVMRGLAAVKVPAEHRVVVKVGSNVLTRLDGALDTTRVSSIVDQIAQLREKGFEVVLVSSGAVACGRSLIRGDEKLSDVQQRQLYSAIGQVRLMDLYYKLFQSYGITVGQVLTQKKNFSEGQEYNNQKSCMEVMLQSRVLPIVNENDTVSITELMFTDNDELSGLVAGMIGAESLIILTNVDGIFDGDPSLPGSRVIPLIRPDDSIEGWISASKSSAGRGGMTSKCQVARNLAASGIRVIIANGRREGILTGVLASPEKMIHTEFEPGKK